MHHNLFNKFGEYQFDFGADYYIDGNSLPHFNFRCSFIFEFEFLEYLERPYEHSDANLIFLTEILMGSTGVIIDIAMTIVSFAMELLSKKPDIKAKALIKSCSLVSENITGTMINVVLFTNLAGSIQLFILSMKNEVGLFTIFRYNIYFEATRFFVGGIGILLTIPLSAVISAIYSKRRQSKCSRF